MSSIILTTINSNYSHTSLSLRYLFANLHELKDKSQIIEFTIHDNPLHISEKILSLTPHIVGFSVYIWNLNQTLEVIKIIQQISPLIKIIIGGPEVSYDFESSNLFAITDHLVIGEGEEALYSLCKNILSDKKISKIIKSPPVDLKNIDLPYKYYLHEDIKNRKIYIETSRGCPFLCQFCLSSIEKVRTFNIDKIIDSLEILWNKGAREFKFIDRTFNLKTIDTLKILNYFLQKNDKFFIHVEMVPEKFSDSLKETLKKFKKGEVQLEIGIQTFNEESSKLIKRDIDTDKTIKNLCFLINETNIHLHTDLIIGLPAEDQQSFEASFNKLYALNPHEIQVGILKKLKGAPIKEHDHNFKMIYSKSPPYEILQNNIISFKSMQKLKRFARYFDIYSNSGNFSNSINLLIAADNAFQDFYNFSTWLYKQCRKIHKISLKSQSTYLFKYLVEEKRLDQELSKSSITEDYISATKGKHPYFLNNFDKPKHHESSGNSRQKKHIL